MFHAVIILCVGLSVQTPALVRVNISTPGGLQHDHTAISPSWRNLDARRRNPQSVQMQAESKQHKDIQL